ncbi:hypothetical protein C0J52_02782 [Blattella germanica]|nr:hypothetical protein C0J52_02782 [Blattella germanica]
MKENLLCCSAAVYLILLLVVSAVHCDGENVGSSSSVVKTRRGSSGLIPMGRVGRGGIPWTFQPSAHFPIADSFLEDGEAFVSVPGKRSEGGSGEANET